MVEINKLQSFYRELRKYQVTDKKKGFVNYLVTKEGHISVRYFLSQRKQALAEFVMKGIGEPGAGYSASGIVNRINIYVHNCDYLTGETYYSLEYPDLVSRTPVEYNDGGKLIGERIQVYLDCFTVLTDYERQNIYKVIPMFEKYIKPNSIRFAVEN